MYNDKLDNVVNKSNNAYHRAIKVKPIDVKSSTHFDFAVANNENDTKFEIDDYLKISQHKKIFGTGFTLNQSEDLFVIKNVKNIVPFTCVIDDLKGKDIVEEEWQKADRSEFRVDNLVKKKGDELCVNWRRHDNSFNSCLVKNDIII